ncbi:FitA-like ribbon-helix-helix domain-containing protein [Methylomagnum ishizawai]|uniref:FitA-like ribbon-helix-helix domain-containing protein n=1 Tax=Methylomagnum ishizawai TaxID=1760988 RepID=UPI001C324B6D|nr:hypothetical protein [Methylomagnum ishizawai]BBL74227.1 hypothetical protein MishRS11D_13250 [Methylomagnum ishizawai]
MAVVSISTLDEETYSRLNAQAARHGVTLEEEVRTILKAAVADTAPSGLGDVALGLFGAEHGIDLELPQRGPHQPMGFPE